MTSTPADREQPVSETTSRKRGRRWLKRLTIAALLVVGIVFSAGFVGNWYAGTQRAALLERFDALGVATWPNGAQGEQADQAGGDAVKTLRDWVAEAQAALPADDVIDRLPAMGSAYEIEPKMALPESMVDSLSAMRPVAEVLLEGLESDAVWWPDRSKMDAFVEMERVLSLSGEARFAARALSEEMWRAMEAGDDAAVARAALGIEAVAESLRGGLLVEALVEISIRALAAGTFEQVLSRGELPASMLLSTAERFEAWADVVSPTDLIEGELSYTRSIVESGAAYLADMDDRLAAEGKASEAWPSRALRSLTSTLFPEIKVWGLVWTAQGTLATYESARDAEADGRLALLAWTQENASDDERLSGDALRSPVKVLAISADQLSVAAAALRVEAWRLEHGDWPTDLAEAHGGTSPTDWAGRPLVYRVERGDALLYGVGMNGVDNGGLVRMVGRSQIPEAADDRSAFWLYTPADRGSLPAPKPRDMAE